MRPGLLALVLVAALALSLALAPAREASILEEAYSQVVVVACLAGGGLESYGTGWFVGERHVVTAFHVVRECPGGVRLVRSPWASQAQLVAFDASNDIAVLRVVNPPEWAEGLPLAYEVSIGDEVFVVGYPVQLYSEVGKDVRAMSEIPRVASGTVSWIHPSRPIFQFDIPTDAGNSGGPVVSKESGGVVGLVVYARPGVVSEGYFGLRMDYVARFLEENGIEYRVAPAAGGRGALLALAGLGLLAAAALLLLARRG